MSFLKTIILFLILLMSIYQDFPLVNSFGEIARSPIIFIFPVMLFYLVKDGKFILSKYSKYFILYILYLVFITVVHVIWLLISEQKLLFIGENIIIKSIKMLVYPIVAFVFYEFIKKILSHNGKNNLNILFNALFALEICLIVFLIFEIKLSKTTEIFMPFIHSTDWKYWRVRLLTAEESWVGTIFTIYSTTTVFLCIYLKKKLRLKLFVIASALFFVLYYSIQSESKGFMLISLIATLPLILNYIYKNKTTRAFLFIFIIAILGFGLSVFESLKEQVSEQFYTSITFGTRLSSYLASLKVLIFHPFGIGLGPFLHYYTDSLRSIVESPLMGNFELSEVKGYLSTTKNLSTKTYFYDNLMFGGVAFLLFFYHFFIKRYFILGKYNYNPLVFVKIPLVFIVLSSILYINFEIKYEIWFFLAFLEVIEKELYNKQNILDA